MSAKPSHTERPLSPAVEYRLGAACGWRRARAGRKVRPMDSTLNRTEISALPGSQRHHLDLPANAASQLFQLRKGQQLLLQVSRGCLWVTQDGRLDDIILAPGSRLQLQEPGNYRLGAFGPADAAVISWSAARQCPIAIS